MIVFHGSKIIIDKPSILFSRDNLDFGKGFYVTAIEEQAISWARRYNKQNDIAYVSRYILNDDMYKDCNVLRFEDYTEDWLDYIVKNRNGYNDEEYDAVYGCLVEDIIKHNKYYGS